MKIFSLTFVLLIAHSLFTQTDTSQVKHTHKISNLLHKVHSISEKNIEHKHQIIKKSKIDSLMFRIDEIKTEKPIQISSAKQDSLLVVINTLKNNILEKDSLINALKIQLTKQLNAPSNLSINKTKHPKNYIVLGAFLQKSNAQQKLANLRTYHVEMVTVGKLNYIVYSLMPNEKINPTLRKFRNQVEPNAWYISL